MDVEIDMEGDRTTVTDPRDGDARRAYREHTRRGSGLIYTMGIHYDWACDFISFDGVVDFAQKKTNLFVASRGVKVSCCAQLGELELESHARGVKLCRGWGEGLHAQRVPGADAQELALHAVEGHAPALHLGMGLDEKHQIAQLRVRHKGVVRGVNERRVRQRQILAGTVGDAQHRHVSPSISLSRGALRRPSPPLPIFVCVFVPSRSSTSVYILGARASSLLDESSMHFSLFYACGNEPFLLSLTALLVHQRGTAGLLYCHFMLLLANSSRRGKCQETGARRRFCSFFEIDRADDLMTG